MTRLRTIGVLSAALLLLAMPGIAAGADLSATGTMSGLAVPKPIEPGVAECHPTASPTDPEDFICDFVATGEFDLDEIGTGTYAGELRLDWSIYTGAEPCAEATGVLTLATAEGTLEIEIDDTSRVCETSDPEVHEATFDVTVVSGTGAFAGASGTLSASGSMTPSAGSGEYDTELDVDGTVSVPDATPTPTPTDDPSPTASLPAVSPTPTAAALPDTASGAAEPLSGMAVALIATLLVALAGTAVARRSV